MNKRITLTRDLNILTTVENGIEKMDMATLDSLDKNKLHTGEVEVE